MPEKNTSVRARAQQSEFHDSKDNRVPIRDHERDQFEGHKAYAHIDLPRMPVWPNWRDGSGLRVTGWCPYCNRPHTHGLGWTPMRVAHCAGAAGGEYLMVFNDEPMPDDLTFALENEPVDLQTLEEFFRPRDEVAYSDRIGGLAEARRNIRKRAPIDRTRFGFAARRLAESGIFAERHAILVEDGGQDEVAAMRSLVAAFIKRQPGATMRERFRQALSSAYTKAVRGEVA